ncbi:hypothetical protein [Psychrobium sp. 1_MG-2023]|uniref:hypothetical protein n=1 Tax=Psychrobium sp. 1_MG-2023 TaxID=3062624 RepID=UPI002735C209|nr:hypothetical protein [Psychrobium sp. 1_MG-2023]MDP2560625.1 hypothetical protein [Psychrobium sp. 1_MG-2023]
MTNIKVPIILTLAIAILLATYWLSSNQSTSSLLESEKVLHHDSQTPLLEKEIALRPKIDVPEAENIKQQLSAVQAEKAAQAARFLPKKATVVTLSVQEMSLIKEQSQLKQAEIALLISEYKTHINDQAKVKALQQQVKRLTAEYNELILPLALNAMAEKNNG